MRSFQNRFLFCFILGIIFLFVLEKHKPGNKDSLSDPLQKMWAVSCPRKTKECLSVHLYLNLPHNQMSFNLDLNISSLSNNVGSNFFLA